MIIIHYFDPKQKYKSCAMGFNRVPKQDELFQRIEEAIKKSLHGFTTLQIGVGNNKSVTIPNAYHVILTEEKDHKSGKILGPDGVPILEPN